MHKWRGGRDEVEKSGNQSMRLRNTRAVLRELLRAFKGFLTPHWQRDVEYALVHVYCTLYIYTIHCKIVSIIKNSCPSLASS